MPADIGENMGLAVIVAGEDQRRAIAVMGHRLPRFGQQRGRRQQMRHLVEDRALLGLEAVGIDIDAGRQRLDAGTEGGLAASKRIGERALARASAGAASGHVHRRGACASRVRCKAEPSAD